MLRTASFAFFICLAVSFAVQPTMVAGTWYAAPAGSPSASGTKTDPWDLQTALNKTGAIRPGDTLYLLGGVYRGKFYSRIGGDPGNPILVTSNPGEWVTIDGNAPAILQAPVMADATSLTVSDTRQALPG